MPRSYAGGLNRPNTYVKSLIVLVNTMWRLILYHVFVVLRYLDRPCMIFILQCVILVTLVRTITLDLEIYLIHLRDVHQMTSRCKICAEIKPRFLKPSYMSLVKANQSMERVSIEFKGPLPSRTNNKYIQ